MLLMAMRVRDVAGREGINAFCRLHGPFDWDGPAPPQLLPEANPGELVNERTSVPPGGNDVRSYVDIIAPDHVPSAEIVECSVAFVRDCRGEPLPWVGAEGRCTFRFGLEPALAPSWGDEFRGLLEAALSVRAPY